MSVLVVNNLFSAVSHRFIIFSHFYGNNHFHNKPTISIKTSVTWHHDYGCYGCQQLKKVLTKPKN